MQIAFEQHFFGFFKKMPKAFLMMIFPIERIVLLESASRIICSLTFTLYLWGIINKVEMNIHCPLKYRGECHFVNHAQG